MTIYNVIFQGKQGHILMVIEAENNNAARKKFNKNISVKERRCGKKQE